jgi:NADH-quinone oxidoreductase subunit G
VCAVAFLEGPIKGIQMSCMVEAQDGMVVSSTDAEAVDFRRHVIEFLMLHHPHDCPVCDEGGHCLLQDLTVAGGHGRRRYEGLKRTHRNQDLGPLVQHEMNRCIQCYRCSRYYQEVTGYRDLGVMGIGNRVYFGRSRPGVLESPFAGNLVDICPTGVFTDKPSRTIGRRWDFQRQASVCIHCSLGCNLTAATRYRQVVRHEARPNRDVNGYFICDRGRYGYAYASAAQRPRTAVQDGEPAPTTQVLDRVRATIRTVTDRSGAGSVALAASPRASLETLAMVQKACRQHGWRGPALVHTTRQAHNLKTALASLQPDLAVSMAGVAAACDALVVGADPLNEAPMLALALRQVQRRGGRVTVIDPRGVRLPFECDHWAVTPDRIGPLLQALVTEIGGSDASPSGASDSFPVAALAKQLNGSPRPVVVCGTDIVTGAEIGLAAELARQLHRTHVEAGLFYTLGGPNAFAAGLVGGHDAATETLIAGIETGAIRMLITVEQDLWSGFPDRPRLQAALAKLEHLAVLDYVDTPLNRQAAYFVPTQPLYEHTSHWINQEGRLQRAEAVMAGGQPIQASGHGDHPPRRFETRLPGGAPLAAWRAVARLADDAPLDDGPMPAAVLAAVHPAVSRPTADRAERRIDLGLSASAAAASTGSPAPGPASAPADGICLLLVDWTVGTESLSAAAPALATLAGSPAARLHPDTLTRLQLVAGQSVSITTDAGQLTVTMAADARMATGVMVVPRHQRLEWQVFGETRVMVDASQLKVESLG